MARFALHPNEPTSERSGIRIPAPVPAGIQSIHEASLIFDLVERWFGLSFCHLVASSCELYLYHYRTF